MRLCFGYCRDWWKTKWQGRTPQCPRVLGLKEVLNKCQLQLHHLQPLAQSQRPARVKVLNVWIFELCFLPMFPFSSWSGKDSFPLLLEQSFTFVFLQPSEKTSVSVLQIRLISNRHVFVLRWGRRRYSFGLKNTFSFSSNFPGVGFLQ